MRTSAKKRTTPPTKTKPAEQDLQLFLCALSGYEVNPEDQWRMGFQVLVPAGDVESVAPILEKHLKRQRREGKIFETEGALTLYLDAIIPLNQPIASPVIVNFRQAVAAPHRGEIANVAPQDSPKIASYKWFPDDKPPADPDADEQHDEPFIVFKSSDGKTTSDFGADQLLFRRAEVEKILGRLPSGRPRRDRSPPQEAPVEAWPAPPKLPTRPTEDWTTFPTATKRAGETSIEPPSGWDDLPQVEAKLPTKRLHPVAEAVRAALANSVRGDNGLRYASGSPIAVRVSRLQMGRALDIIDRLVRGLERRGHRIVEKKDDYIRIGIGDEHFSVELRETVRQYARSARDASGVKYDRTPSGQLTLTFVPERELFYVDRHGWDERGSTPLEDRIDEIVQALEAAAETLRLRRAELRAREEEKVRLEQERRQAERESEEQRRHEAQRREVLFKQVADWRRAEELRQFIAAASATAMWRGQTGPHGRLEEWMRWASMVADEIDPLKGG